VDSVRARLEKAKGPVRDRCVAASKSSISRLESCLMKLLPSRSCK
jgi:hypothetical protein